MRQKWGRVGVNMSVTTCSVTCQTFWLHYAGGLNIQILIGGVACGRFIRWCIPNCNTAQGFQQQTLYMSCSFLSSILDIDCHIIWKSLGVCVAKVLSSNKHEDFTTGPSSGATLSFLYCILLTLTRWLYNVRYMLRWKCENAIREVTTCTVARKVTTRAGSSVWLLS